MTAACVIWREHSATAIACGSIARQLGHAHVYPCYRVTCRCLRSMFVIVCARVFITTPAIAVCRLPPSCSTLSTHNINALVPTAAHITYLATALPLMLSCYISSPSTRCRSLLYSVVDVSIDDTISSQSVLFNIYVVAAAPLRYRSLRVDAAASKGGVGRQRVVGILRAYWHGDAGNAVITTYWPCWQHLKAA